MEKTITIIDPTIAKLIQQELLREQTTINLIASENYAPEAILEATGSVLTNKYAEGYPGKRYYAGCEIVDQVEQCAIDRCKNLFKAEHANVQPHAGSQANMAVYHALLKPGDTILGMSLACGGHLTHGHAVSFSGKIYNAIQYGVDPETELLDYDNIARLAQEHTPKLIIAGASAYSRTIDFKKFAEIARSVGAYLLVDMAHIAGLVAAGVHPSPVEYADCITSTTHKTLRGPRGALILSRADLGQAIDRAVIPGLQGGPCMNVIAAKAVCFENAQKESFVAYQKNVIKNAQAMARAFLDKGYRIVSGGTDNHLFILDLRTKGITGLEAEQLLTRAHITTNRNCIPFDPEKPWITSGIRIGTPAITTRGFSESDACLLVELIDALICRKDDSSTLDAIANKVINLCKQYPIYTGFRGF